VDDPLICARAVHFAATILASGTVFFAVFVAEPALARAKTDVNLAATLRLRFACIVCFSLALAVFSGAAWLVLTAESMSGQALADVWPQGVLGTVLTQTDFGNDWLLRFVLACLLGVLFAKSQNYSRRAGAALALLAATFVGSLAWAGHAIGAQGIEGLVHPAADVLHLIAAAAWVGALVPLAMLLTATKDEASLGAARIATLRFSTLGIVSVGTLLVTGIVNSWYLVGGIPEFTGTDYGRLLLIKIALFLGMVALAAVNRLHLTPAIAQAAGAAAQRAIRRLRRNAVIEAITGTAVIAIVAALGTLPPASHANHHPAYGGLPPDAAFVHIHTEEGMADVMIEPGHVGKAQATVRLWTGDFEPLDAQGLTFKLTAPVPGSKPEAHIAVLNADGAWQIDGLDLTQPGNWTVEVDAVLAQNRKLELDAPIVIDPAK
jgi:putative copper resistance protein D